MIPHSYCITMCISICMYIMLYLKQMDEMTASNRRVDVDPLSNVTNEPMSSGTDNDSPRWKYYLKKAQRAAMHGVDQEIVQYKKPEMQKAHEVAPKYDNKPEKNASYCSNHKSMMQEDAENRVTCECNCYTGSQQWQSHTAAVIVF
jgi:hypothetical protein